MSMEKLDHVVVGVLVDFMGFLTVREERLVLSSRDDSAPAVTAIQEFLKLRGVENCEPLLGWEHRCGSSKAPDAVRPTSVYVASRASVPERPEMWRNLRAKGLPVSSTWIDEAGEGETKDFEELWTRIESEVRSSDCLTLYVEPGDLPLKGALVEVGMALAMEKPVAIVLGGGLALEAGTFRPLGSWAAHPLCRVFSDMDMALGGMGFSTTQETVGCKDPVNCSCRWPGMLSCHNYASHSLVYRPGLFRDGDQWCALSGDNLQDGLCAFGGTPVEAIRSFDSLGRSPPALSAAEPAGVNLHSNLPLSAALRDVVAERQRQDAKWGGPGHDDLHSFADWHHFIDNRLAGSAYADGARKRELFMEIAALAVAAAESIDRKGTP